MTPMSCTRSSWTLQPPTGMTKWSPSMEPTSKSPPSSPSMAKPSARSASRTEATPLSTCPQRNPSASRSMHSITIFGSTVSEPSTYSTPTVTNRSCVRSCSQTSPPVTCHRPRLISSALWSTTFTLGSTPTSSSSTRTSRRNTTGQRKEFVGRFPQISRVAPPSPTTVTTSMTTGIDTNSRPIPRPTRTGRI